MELIKTIPAIQNHSGNTYLPNCLIFA